MARLELHDSVIKLPSYPTKIYVNGEELDQWDDYIPDEDWGGNEISFIWDYQNSEGGDNFNVGYYTSGGFGTFFGSYGDYVNGFDFWGQIDRTGAFLGLGYNTVTFAPSSSPPAQGPQKVAWNGHSLGFTATGTQYGEDNYRDLVSGEGVAIYPDGTVDVSGPYTTSGSYDPDTNQFNFSGDPNMQNIAAQDASGELLGIPNGLEVYFTATGGAQSIQLGDGSYRTPANSTVYTFQRPDGSFGVRYLGIPANSPLIIQDTNGNYTSPVYVFRPAGNGSCVIDASDDSGWPASNLYPNVLYVNGSYTTIDIPTVAISGSGQSQTGRVTFDVNPYSGGQYAGQVNLSWTWSSGGFSAAVNGNYGGYSSFSGTWDGTLFNGLPKGLVISTSAPSPDPSLGPLQISWNGVDLTYNAVASSVSGSNPTGTDVYQDGAGIGLSATIASDGTTVLTGADGTQYAGSYSADTGQFSFSGTSPGNVVASGNQSSGGGGGQPPASPGQSMEVNGNLDIQGNILTLGTWMHGSSASVNAIALYYTDTQNGNPSLLQFAGTRGSLDWVWSEATSDNADPQIPMMELDPSHRLILHDTTTQNAPGVTLDPTGPSRFKNPVLIAPQGDIGMGPFTTGTAP